MKVKREALVSNYITEAFLLLLKNNDYRDISVTAICKKAGVTRMSFYRNFESKEDILYKKVQNITDRFLETSTISYKDDTIHDYFVKLFTHMKEQKEICTVLYKAGLIHIIKNEFDKVFLKTYRHEYSGYKSAFLAGGIYNVFLFWFTADCKESPEDLANSLEELFQK